MVILLTSKTMHKTHEMQEDLSKNSATVNFLVDKRIHLAKEKAKGNIPILMWCIFSKSQSFFT